MTALHFLAIGVAVFCFVTTFPLVLELGILSLSALILRRSNQPRTAPAAGKFHIIVPAHNEAVLIDRCVRSLLAAADAHTRVSVIAHNCTDNTADIATAAGAEAWVLNDSGERGKGAALFYAFERAVHEGAVAVIVVDADSTVSPNFLAEFRNAFALGADAVQAKYIVANADENDRTRLLGLSFLGINVVRPLGRDRLGLSCGIFGNGFALSAATLHAIPYTAHSVVEDLEYHLMLVESGRNVRFLSDAVVYGEMPNNTAAAATQRSRWEGGRSRMRRIYAPKLARHIATHGHLSLIEPFLDLLTLPLGTELVLLALAAAMPLDWSRTYGAIGLTCLALHVGTAITFAPNPASTAKALASVPRHLFFKLSTIAQRRRAATNKAGWQRTARNEEQAATQQAQ